MTDSPAQRFWRGRRVFLTGHTGFKGAWLALWLHELKAEVTGYALAPAGRPNLWDLLDLPLPSVIGDLRDAPRLEAALRDSDAQIVLHLAAQSLVRESYRDPLGTMATNVLGTANLLQACRALPALAAVVVVTSDKVYENRAEGRAFTEDDRLGGHDPYSSSKACAELLTASFRDSFFAAGPPLATARAGNVIGGGDWAAERIIPDCVRALAAGQAVTLRYPEAVRPWQHVLEPLSGYLELARALVETPARAPRAVNFGPDPAAFCTVREVVEGFSARCGGRPGWVPDGAEHPREAALLTLSSALARASLGWRPRLDKQASLAWTADWYRAQTAGEDMKTFSAGQIRAYRELAGGVT